MNFGGKEEKKYAQAEKINNKCKIENKNESQKPNKQKNKFIYPFKQTTAESFPCWSGYV
jgi:hypothetical protein